MQRIGIPTFGIGLYSARLSAVVTLLRPKEWVKNAVVLAPAMFSPWAINSRTVSLLICGFACFCSAASAVYILNDLCDREQDRLHPTKRLRPLAAGTVNVAEAVGLFIILTALALTGAAMLSPEFARIVGAYFVVNVLYSLWLKHVSIVDILLIAIGFVLRLDGGGALVNIQPSVYLMVCIALLALFLAIGKRRDDIVKQIGTTHRASLSGYTAQFLDISMAVVLGCLLVSYMIYTTDPAVAARIGTHKLYLTLPFVLAGILRYLQIAMVEERSGAPAQIIFRDRFLLATIAGWIGVFGILLYG